MDRALKRVLSSEFPARFGGFSFLVEVKCFNNTISFVYSAYHMFNTCCKMLFFASFRICILKIFIMLITI